MKKIITSALVASTLAMAGGDIAPVVEEVEVIPAATEESSDWQHRILLYGWLPSIDGTLLYPVPGTEVGVDAGQILDALNMTFMGVYEGRKDKFSFKADVLYLDLSQDKDNALISGNPSFEAGIDLSLTAWMLGFYGGYTIYQSDKIILDAMAGVRYLSIDTDAILSINGPLPPQLPSPNLSASAELWDGVIGIKGIVNLAENWYVPYHFDIGTGDSELTWQALAGVGYRYGWGDLLLVYRHTSYDQGDAGLVQDMTLSGPAIAVNFNF